MNLKLLNVMSIIFFFLTFVPVTLVFLGTILSILGVF